MLVIALNSGHDGATAVIQDRELTLSFESEKDSFLRHAFLSPTTILDAAAHLDRLPDAVALGGWGKRGPLAHITIGAGYGLADAVQHRQMRFFGQTVTMYSSSHVRSHLMMAVGMAPRDDASERAVLIWEGAEGSFYLLNEKLAITRHVPVLSRPGWRYSFLFGLADPSFPDRGRWPRNEDAGKLMALAAYGSSSEANTAIRETVDRILTLPDFTHRPKYGGPAPKGDFADSPVYNSGVESTATKTAAALLTERIFDIFASAAVAQLPAGIPLHISGGCGLNCDWNSQLRELGHFSSTFVPPCANDSGSAIGTAIDALHFLTADPFIEWSVYSGLEFDWDCEPDPARWRRRQLDYDSVARAIAQGHIVAWVQGRWEIGPRALGNRSILAEPFDPRTRDRLNEIKQREGYRPIAPCCRVEDLGRVFNETFEDPYMLYFRTARSGEFGAVTHVDGTARCQTVSDETNLPLHRLLSSFSTLTGFGVVCNTSLNFKGLGFINRMSDLAKYCETRGLDDMVVGDAWFERVDG